MNTKLESSKLHEERAERLHEKAIYIQGLESAAEPGMCVFNADYAARLKENGVTAINATVVGSHEDLQNTILRMIDYRENIARTPGVIFGTKGEDVRKAKRNGELAVFLGLQNSLQIGDDLRLLRALYELGLRIMGLAYSRRTLVGDGCGERTDSGLSEFGVRLVEEMNRIGMLVDLSHVGRKSSMEAIEFSRDPVVFSHANPRRINDHVRNIDDEQMKALAEKGGVMGICAFRLILRPPGETPTMEDFLRHVDYAVDTIGVDHVGIGLDRGLGPRTVEHYESVKRRFPELRVGMDFETWANGAIGVREPRNDLKITGGLLARGYSDQEVMKILGGNFLRVFETVFKG